MRRRFNAPPVRPFYRWIALAAASLAILAAAVALASRFWISPMARREVIREIEEKFQSDVEIASLHVSLLPLRVTGERLILRQKDHPGAPPLITLRRFVVFAGWPGVLRSPHHVSRVDLEGLEIRVSRRNEKQENDDPPNPPRPSARPKTRVVVDFINADGTLLEILPKDEGKQPLRFDIYKLALHSAGNDRPMRYQATLRNAQPPGIIDAHGSFGPWNAGEPGETPLDGQYRFDNANLGVFHGISGTLFSTGRFSGILERIEVSGHTDTPDFAVDVSGHQVHLATDFSATVDGVHGDTLLHPVDARFGQSNVRAEGGVTQKPGINGKTVSLHATVSGASLADVLRLGVKGRPPMTGRIGFEADIVIPPGERDIAEKLRLDGKFNVDSGRFTKMNMQQKVTEFSKRARDDGDDNDAGAGAGEGDVFTRLQGCFNLADGVIGLNGLSFAVPGALIRLHGRYNLETEALLFHGTARTEATVSHLTTGWKSFLLKAIDPFFKKKNAGAEIPIHISGSRSSPSVGLDLP